jgi:hypothetical protein
MGVWLGEHRQTHYRTVDESDPGAMALTAERASEELAEREALKREKDAEEERRQKELHSLDNEILWTRFG